MSNKAVFLDRDHTMMEDPGYLNDPGAVRLLPGVELAIKSLAQAGYKIVVVTNQSGVARGLLTEETLAKIHAELRRQLAEKGAHLDAVYYCPYHPEGTVEKYAIDSDMRKPKPGMILQACKDLEIDPTISWMVGDSPRDVEAGQRAGCHTIRVRGSSPPVASDENEDVQADYTLRNLVDAARVILREEDRTAEAAAVPAAAPAAPRLAPASPPAPAPAPVAAKPPLAGEEHREVAMSDSQVRKEILRHLRQMARTQHEEEFSFLKLSVGILEMLVLAAVVFGGFFNMMKDRLPQAQIWLLTALVLQCIALTIFTAQRKK